MRFKDKVVIITGAGSGIGRVMAHRFAAEGAKVAVVDWLADRADTVAAEISEAGGQAAAIHTDVSSKVGVDSMVAFAVSRFGPVDVLVNNAAIADGDDVLQIDDATWDHDVSVVLKSVFLCSKAVLPSMIERGSGAIVNIASVNGMSALGNEAYSAAKAGVINLTQGIAVRYGAHGIRCNAIAPGTIRTPIWQERIDRDPVVFERLVKWYPLGRVGEPEDVANAALFLASDEASWITGTVLPVDGGLLAGNFRMTRELLAEAGSEELDS
ncbi:MAG TPA: glucose 1-dehydrogenase [Candidatus Limnocylindria bacterium]|jgi:NAD(P)-dependent dehydrogenase (short-subunit alcohol dehydrogenase family)|nr:glucose 1-dehydrogenase [Candidatus Limnocylindria bacterium]